MSVRNALAVAVERRELDPEVMEAAIAEILAGTVSPLLVASFAIAMRTKGESVQEIASAARALRGAASHIDFRVSGPLLDTCGTGGDGAGSFNISTVSAIVAASCGVHVAKHGNRAVSSRCGSADVLETLGVNLGSDEDALQRCMRDAGIAFLFAPAHHAALRHAAAARKELGMRTLFNLLGPLSNPAGATHQVVGVFAPERVESTAHVLVELGIEGAWVVHGHGGLDEISPEGATKVAAVDGPSQPVRVFDVRPEDFGLAPAPLDSLEGGDAEENAAIALRILDGEGGGPRTAVLLNTAAALVVAGVAENPKEAAERAAKAIDEGHARATLDAWVRASVAS